MVLKDRFGRPVLNLRVSVTQRCNLHCSYCHREGQEKTVENKVVEMSVDEIVRLVKIAVRMGMNRVKLTGGEPLVRNDILEIVESLGKISGLKDLSMTTNGTLLAKYAEELYQKGLMRVNVNIPTLNPETYSKLTGGRLRDVLEGIKAAVDAGLYPVKLNMLILKGVNDHEVWSMVNFASKTGTILQLIELEPINISKSYYLQHHCALDDYELELGRKAISVETRRFMHNRRIYHLPEAKVEVIHPMENTEFCAHCTRLRITSDGKLKPCLMRNDNLVDVLTPLRNGASDKELEQLFLEAIRRREPFFSIERKGTGQKKEEL